MEEDTLIANFFVDVSRECQIRRISSKQIRVFSVAFVLFPLQTVDVIILISTPIVRPA